VLYDAAERVLAHVPYWQWTMSFPYRVRWVLLKEAGLLSNALSLLLRAVFALQRRRARRLGLRGWAGCHRVIGPSEWSQAAAGVVSRLFLRNMN
jgi:hypothetical protein